MLLVYIITNQDVKSNKIYFKLCQFYCDLVQEVNSHKFLHVFYCEFFGELEKQLMEIFGYNIMG